MRLHGRTDVGLVREHNEDSFLVVRLDDGSRELDKLAAHTLGPRGTLLVVCDGMGGAAAGEVASGMAVESLATTMLDERMVDAARGRRRRRAAAAWRASCAARRATPTPRSSARRARTWRARAWAPP